MALYNTPVAQHMHLRISSTSHSRPSKVPAWAIMDPRQVAPSSCRALRQSALNQWLAASPRPLETPHLQRVCAAGTRRKYLLSWALTFQQRLCSGPQWPALVPETTRRFSLDCYHITMHRPAPASIPPALHFSLLFSKEIEIVERGFSRPRL